MSEMISPLLSSADLKAEGIPYTNDHIRRLVKQERFPRPVKLNGPFSPNAWLKHEIDAWKKARVAERDAASGTAA
jgi:predicted DNA-binding transcriptional regulator AlpA